MIEVTEAVKKQVSDELGLYVYVLVDPRTSKPFYVGKGRGLRFDSHGHFASPLDENESGLEIGRKTQVIHAIKSDGYEPQTLIVRYGLSQAEYTAVEAAVIDLLMTLPLTDTIERPILPLTRKDQLTNARRESARGHGIRLLDDLVQEFAAPELTTEIPLLLITLSGWKEQKGGERLPDGYVRTGNGYKQEWLTARERDRHVRDIGQSVSGYWVVSPGRVEASGIRYAVAVHRGVTRALFRIVPESWANGEVRSKRWGFDIECVTSGADFDSIVGPYGHRVSHTIGARNPISYWPR